MKLFIVIPVLNEAGTVDTLARGILQHTQGHEVRVLFVDDGSRDGTTEKVDALAAEFSEITVLHFRRNFGKSQALAAAFAKAEGDVVITMDGDLQDDPGEIPRLLAKLDEGYDVVCGWKENRRDPWHKTLPSRVYNKMMRKFFDLDLHDMNTGFKAMRIEVARNLVLYGEMHRLITVFATTLGYRVTEIPVEHHPRTYGKSKYGFERFYRGALDALTAWFLWKYQYSPSHFFGTVGLLIVLVGIFFSVLGLGVGIASYALLPAMVLWFTGLLAIFSGGLLYGMGLVAELIVRKLPPPTSRLYVKED